MNSEYLLERIFEKVDTIPPFPKTAQRALEILRSDEVDFRELEEVIKSDPGIAANFLKLVNSALFYLPQKVTSLLKAFILLGTNQIRFILLSSVAGKYFIQDLRGYGVSAKDIWLHSIACGLCAEEIANIIKVPPEDREILYLASLLHDIGKIVLDLFTIREENRFYQAMAEHQSWSFLEIEWLVLGVDHGLVGGYLLQRWGFPEEIYFAVRAHHDPDLMIQRRISAIVGLSNMIVTQLGITGGVDAFNYCVPSELLEVVGIEPQELDQIMLRLLKRTILLEGTLL